MRKPEHEVDQLRNELNLALRSWKKQVRAIRDDRDEKERERDEARKYNKAIINFDLLAERDKANKEAVDELGIHWKSRFASISDCFELAKIELAQVKTERDEASKLAADMLELNGRLTKELEDAKNALYETIQRVEPLIVPDVAILAHNGWYPLNYFNAIGQAKIQEYRKFVPKSELDDTRLILEDVRKDRKRLGDERDQLRKALETAQADRLQAEYKSDQFCRERDDARKDAEYSRRLRIGIELDRDKANNLVIINDLKRLKQLNEMQIQRDEAKRCNANQLKIINEIYAIADPKDVRFADEVIKEIKDTFVKCNQLRKLLELAQAGRLQTEYKSDKLREVCDKLAGYLKSAYWSEWSEYNGTSHYQISNVSYQEVQDTLIAYANLPHVIKDKRK